MLMAVASDLPSLENQAELDAAENSVLFADGPGCREPNDGCRIARLTGNLNRILVQEGEISPHIKNAVIAIEDRRFYQHEGVDYAGIARALWQDIRRRSAAQGGSTITQQFVKNALSAQADRSVFQKLRESALAYHLEREWSKEKILTQYLNTVYFGNGAYGIESAMRTYFGDGDEPDELRGAGGGSGVTLQSSSATEDEEAADPDRREAGDATPAEAAMLAGMIASPTMYDPIENPAKAVERRDLVLERMLDQDMISRAEYEAAVRTAPPDEDEVDPPDAESDQPYFTSWMTEHLTHEFGAGRVFSGGLKVKTTLDPELQAAAESAVAGRLAGIGPSASLVAIENRTGEVKAMVGGTDFDATPFNLATNGHRQPGSAFKPFILVRALADGIDPNSTWASQPKQIPFRGKKGPEIFDVRNYEDSYLGVASLWSATAASDNSVFAELGMKVKPRRVARLANRMGIRTELSTNPAMLLGGLEEGVTPLEMAYAYSTLANNGERRSGTLAPDDSGPVAIDTVYGRDGDELERNELVKERVFPAAVGQTAKDMLGLVVSGGTGKAAQVGDEFIWGKTGTTENYGDAWFVGGNETWTVAVWVGYADRVQAMEYEHAGGPVAGGTFPAEIFHDFMTTAVDLRDARRAARGDDEDDEDTTTSEGYVPPVDESGVPEAEQSEPTTPAEPEGEAPDAAPQPETPPQETPEPAPPVEPAPPPETPSGGEGGGGTAPGGTG
jgi:penicillin-binding protein 1A